MLHIAFLGLGAMGSRLAVRLLQAGHQVVVYNRNLECVKPLQARGAQTAVSPCEAAKQADFVISMVTDDQASKSVWLAKNTGAIHGLREGAIAIESSTLTPAWIKELSAKLSTHKADLLDAPVVGSRPHADSGSLIYLVGGSAQVLTKSSQIFSAASSQVHHVGPVGAGMTMKLAINTLFGIQVAAVGEVLGFMQKSGLELNHVINILNEMPTTSVAMQRISGIMATQSFAPNFPIKLVEKDFAFVTDVAQQVGAQMPTATAVKNVYIQADRKGYGNDDISGVMQLYA